MTQYSPQIMAASVSPAEAQFWQEKAQAVPAQLREALTSMPPDVAGSSPVVYPRGAAALTGIGAVLTVASFTKLFPGKWKWLSGALAAGSFGTAGAINHAAKQMNNDIKNAALENAMQARAGYLAMAGALQRDPALMAQLGDYFAKTITAEDIQNYSLDGAVVMKTAEFAQRMQYAGKTPIGVAR